MYIYCISSGEYEQIDFDYFTGNKEYTQKEFERMVKYTSDMWYLMRSYYPDDYTIPTSSELLNILFGFEKMIVTAWIHE